ncbi:hypothetical protein [Leptonema illini]|uniref:Lipoprotein n=1 Tax=Leptonema illini DSM 21528 TaxID=929563 RepID=H2CHX5_9LEPT|nr:hypothetical protein [Leptonema illini]EHQ06997.1 hypothetical protein Lepil_2321 [Leptonema illini DSM 21528]
MRLHPYALILFSFLALSSCTTFKQWIPFLREETKPHVVIAFHDKAPQIVVLVRDMDLPITVAPAGSMPFTHNSHAVLIVGHAFPYEKLAEILEFVRNYYTDLHYVRVTDPLNRRTLYTEHARLYVGASTDEAVQAGLTPWTPADFEELRRVKSQQEMIQLIKRKSAPAKQAE